MTVKNIPLDTFYLGEEDIDNYIFEYTDAVYSTRTASWDDVLKGFMFSWVAILMYYYGWGHYLAKYLAAQGTKETDFFEALRQWIVDNPDTMLHKEYMETQQHHIDTYHNEKLWGRKVRGEDDIYWEYKGASSVVMHDNQVILEEELCRFLRDTKLVDDFPVRVATQKSVANQMLGINNSSIIIDHHDKTQMDPVLWYQKAYHWDRKSRYWRCSAVASDK
jgi:hypothetical protein